MRKIKISLLSLAVMAAIGSALTTKIDQGCVNLPQYYKTASGYLPAGEFGVDFFCWDNAGICTYYRPDPINQPNTYLPCHLGTFQSLDKKRSNVNNFR